MNDAYKKLEEALASYKDEEPKLELTLKEAKALKSITFNQYIHYENLEANNVINKIYLFITEQEKK